MIEHYKLELSQATIERIATIPVDSHRKRCTLKMKVPKT